MGSTTAAFGDLDHVPVRHVLLAALHQDRHRLANSPIERLSTAQWHELVTIAGYQRVRPLVHQRLLESGFARLVPTHTWEQLQQECRAIAVRKLRMHGELAGILRALHEAAIPVIVLKGAFLGPVVYGNIVLREMNDLDLMVPREELRAATNLMLSRGFQGAHEFSVEIDARSSHHATPLIIRGLAGLELHWNITPPLDATAIAPQSLWRDAQPTVIEGVHALRLSPQDLLLHLAFHASYLHQFEFGLRPCCDIAATIARFNGDLDWESIARCAENRKWSAGCAAAFRLARDLVGANVPDEFVRPVDAAPAIAVARELLWATPSDLRGFHGGLAPLGAAGSITAKLKAASQRVFVPKAQLMAIYRVAPTTGRWWPILYGYRLLDLIWRHGQSSVRLMRRDDQQQSALAEQRNFIRQWLEHASSSMSEHSNS